MTKKMTMHRFKISKAGETFERFVTTEDPEHVANFWRVVGFHVDHSIVDVIATDAGGKASPKSAAPGGSE